MPAIVGRLARRVVRLAATLQEATAAVAEVRTGERGTVTLAVVGTLADTALTERLRRFREERPLVDVRVRTGLSAQVSDFVRRGEASVGLRYEPDANPELECTPLYEEPLVLVCAAEHPLAGQAVEPRRLAGERWVTFPPTPTDPRKPYAAALRRHLAAAGLDGAEIVPIDSLTAQKRMVEAGFGVAFLPASSLDEELRRGSLARLDVREMRAAIGVVLVQRRNAYVSRATASLVAHLSSWA